MRKSVKDNKSSLRILLQYTRRRISKQERKEAQNEIEESMRIREEYRSAQTVCLYMSSSGEVDTKPMLADLLERGIAVVFPRVEHGKLVLRRVSSVRDFTKGSYGILEPKKSCKLVPPALVDLFIIPGIAFDRRGYRVGWGKGYYDTLLAGVTSTKIGIAYAVQLIAEVFHTSYDVPMDMVITEKEVVVCRR